MNKSDSRQLDRCAGATSVAPACCLFLSSYVERKTAPSVNPLFRQYHPQIFLDVFQSVYIGLLNPAAPSGEFSL